MAPNIRKTHWNKSIKSFRWRIFILKINTRIHGHLFNNLDLKGINQKLLLICTIKPTVRMIRFYSTIRDWFVGDLLSKTTNLYERAKIELNFNFPFFGCILFITASLTLLLFKIDHSIPAVTLSWIIALGILFLIKITKNIKISSFILSIAIFGIAITNLFANNHTFHIGFPYWLVIQILFTVFTLSMYWGIFFGVTGGIAYIIYHQFFLFSTYQMTSFDPGENFIQFTVEIGLATSLFLYLIFVFRKTSQKSLQVLILKNKQIKTQFEEKEIMLREIHHRVKNNLQVVNSMLRLQAYDILDPKSREAFELSQKRIHAMSLIHERLYQQNTLSEDVSPEYVKILADDLIELYKNKQDISLVTECCKGLVNQKNVVPFGLIINELISNSIKHGILEKGSIFIRSKQIGNDIVLEYSDNGIGFAPGYKKGFGLELIETLVDQIDGKLSYKNTLNNGAQFTLTIPIKSGKSLT